MNVLNAISTGFTVFTVAILIGGFLYLLGGLV